jgi:hypothetical protein
MVTREVDRALRAGKRLSLRHLRTMPVRSSAHTALRYSVSVRAWVHTKLIRQIVLTVIWTELKRRAAAPLLSLCCPQPGAIAPQSRGARWPRTIRVPQNASVTTAEPAVARDQVIDRVPDHPWKDPYPLPARKLARRSAASDFT